MNLSSEWRSIEATSWRAAARRYSGVDRATGGLERAPSEFRYRIKISIFCLISKIGDSDKRQIAGMKIK